MRICRRFEKGVQLIGPDAHVDILFTVSVSLHGNTVHTCLLLLEASTILYNRDCVIHMHNYPSFAHFFHLPNSSDILRVLLLVRGILHPHCNVRRDHNGHVLFPAVQ